MDEDGKSEATLRGDHQGCRHIKNHNSVAFKWHTDGLKSNVHRIYYVSVSDTTEKFRFSTNATSH
jgi:hypothetical protein